LSRLSFLMMWLGPVNAAELPPFFPRLVDLMKQFWFHGIHLLTKSQNLTFLGDVSKEVCEGTLRSVLNQTKKEAFSVCFFSFWVSKYCECTILNCDFVLTQR